MMGFLGRKWRLGAVSGKKTAKTAPKGGAQGASFSHKPGG
jgi:hypothetical protein